MPRKRKAAETEVGDSAEGGQQQQHRQPFQPYPVDKAYRLIEPGPVLLVSTGSLAEGTHNLMAMGFHMMMQHEGPPLIGACVGPWDASFRALRSKKQCVLAVPCAEMAATVVDIGNCSADDGDGDAGDCGRLDKWARFGLEPLPAEKVGAPLVGGRHVMANLECVVEDSRLVSKYSMWVLRVVRAWAVEERVQKGRMLHHRGNGVFSVDGETLDLQGRMTKWKQFQD